MTLDGLMELATAKLDLFLSERWDNFALRLIEAGVDPDGPESDPVDVPGEWRRLSFQDALQHQKDLDTEWRRATLVQLRIDLAREFKLSIES
jgi:hypothetical protein